MLTSSSTYASVNEKTVGKFPLAIDRDGARVQIPQGERALAPTSCTVSEVMEVTGATPGWSASKSVNSCRSKNLRQLPPPMTSPTCVLNRFHLEGIFRTVTASDLTPN